MNAASIPPHPDTVTMLAQALRLGDVEREHFERLTRRKPRGGVRKRPERRFATRCRSKRRRLSDA
jgi:hypothetical protein